MAGQQDALNTKTGQVSETKDIERGPEQPLTINTNQSDPVVREMAIVVLKEIERKHKRRAKRQCIAWIAFLFGMLIAIVTIALGGWTKLRRHY